MEKIIVDAEMLRGWAQMLKTHDFSEDEIALEAIRGVSPGGNFFESPHTLARYKTAFYQPLLSDWSNFENWQDGGSRTATDRASELWKKARDTFIPPPLDEGVRENLAAFMARRKAELAG